MQGSPHFKIIGRSHFSLAAKQGEVKAQQGAFREKQTDHVYTFYE